MRTNLFKTAAFTLISILFFGCVSSIEKRRYRKGYHFAHSGSVKAKAKDAEVSKPQISVETIVVNKRQLESPKNEIILNTNESLKMAPKHYHYSDATINESNTRIAIIKARAISDVEKESIASATTPINEPQKVNGLWYFLSLLMIPFASKYKKANNIARWSQQNKTKSRALVILGNVMGVGCGLAWGICIISILNIGCCLFRLL